MPKRGNLYIISGPSGAGKSTVISVVMAHQHNVHFSVSATTRKPRPGEKDGMDYYFVSREKFAAMLDNGELLEFAQYVDNFYGTPRAPIEAHLEAGDDIILDIEVQGARQVKTAMPEAVAILVVPPDFDTLERRLRERGTDSESVILSRLETAKRDYQYAEVYDYIVVNDEVDHAAGEISAIMVAEKCRTKHRISIVKEVL